MPLARRVAWHGRLAWRSWPNWEHALATCGVRNVGMYRLQVHDATTLGMHWQMHKGGAEHQRAALRERSQYIQVAVSLGGDPAVMWAGSAPLPPDIDEFLLAGWLRGQPVPLAMCQPAPGSPRGRGDRHRRVC